MKSYGSLNEKFVLNKELVVTKAVRAKLRRIKNEASMDGVKEALAYLSSRYIYDNDVDQKKAWRRARKAKMDTLSYLRERM